MLSAEVFDKRFYDLLDLQQEPTVIAEGCVFTEGPIWDPNTQEFTFSDTRNGGRTYRWSKETGVRVIRAYSNAANGEAFDAQGRILQCEHFAHRVIRMNQDTTAYEVLAARFEGRKLNSPNDVIVRNSTGIVYFTDPHFGRRPVCTASIRIRKRSSLRPAKSTHQMDWLSRRTTRPPMLQIPKAWKSLFLM